MKSALIGYTGFVGSNLKDQNKFTELYNSKNFQSMKDQEYDLVVCAGVSAVKWMANKNPHKDLENIKALEDIIATIKVKQFILISTIDVYSTTQMLDENFDFNSVTNHAYGTHRLAFEKFCFNKFSNCTIIRLPGLFGDGLKKNVIYDLLNDNCLELINDKSSYQYYYLKYLWEDIQIAVKNKVGIINFFTEPVPTREIIDEFFSGKKVGKNSSPLGHYNLYTKFSNLWSKKNHYIYSKEEVMDHLSEFISDYENVKG